ncbi:MULTISPECIES: 1-acyl-sn-glycerol-3-phosphate acyltransferase [unclassified Oceanispirochaeta]|uniref:1-acyl-sn-glycerol-3-phosphate acyltransferase n=1 Tax=unclassified Oceanispirochaeta TaxID=2635722 RepID=UPI000E09A3A2|nr:MULTISPECIES: 1-acyl-sn-glycerol-3-phosphate acyltransferase [unclassified Oceanispirochaeta]MBF9016264.1 1-acyl-sn-glycerol-3-phosphate acyltransferase [Oceanispirochaeta sp. M2]NPD72726.1 hypothetical protein [Oceanispirochaeta sp. M1]RDG31574.1 hypothetical protein DV872_11510 [Oceanispirochaeta sp. M1]
MRKLKLKSARLSKGYISPRFSPIALGIMNLSREAYMKTGEKISGVKLFNPDPFCRALKDQQKGKNRLIILFRHSEKADAPSLMYAVNKTAEIEGHKLGIKFQKRPHALFLYGKDVPNWAGALAAWIFPRLGHIPVINRGLCRESINDIRKALEENRFPMALAPEGQVTYHSHKTAELEPGIIHMAEWASEHGSVQLLPVAMAYDYGERKESLIQKVRLRWIKETGLTLPEFGRNQNPYDLLIEMTEKTLTLLEESFPPSRAEADNLDMRIATLNETILKEAEKIANIRRSGSVLDRIFKLRYKGVDAWYPENSNPAVYSPWDKSRSDYNSLKAALYVRCSQIVDVLEYIHTSYISDTPLNNRHCEYALNIMDVVNRFRGGNIGTRYTPEMRRALLLPGDPIDFNSFDRNQSKKERFKSVSSHIAERLQYLSETIEDYLI